MGLHGPKQKGGCRVVIDKGLGDYYKGQCFEEQVGMEKVFQSGQGCYVVTNTLLFELNG